MSTTRDADGNLVRTPGTGAAGSQTNMTRVLPAAPRDTPNHGLTSGLICRAGSSGGVGRGRNSSARSASSGFAAQYPLRVRTLMPGFLMLTCTS